MRLLVCLPLCLLLAPAYPAPLTEVPAEFPSSAEEGPAKLPKTDASPDRDPVAFLEKCLEHYDRTVKGYSLTMRKQERMGGKLLPVEVVEVHFKDTPHSVFFKWTQNPRKAWRVVYVEGENNGKMLALPTIKIVGVVARDVDSDDARQSGRYPITEFGLEKAMQRVLTNWKKARAENALHVEYQGVHKVPEAGGRPCHKLLRTRYARPEDDGVTELTLYIDIETLLQVGSVLKGPSGELVAAYFFRDIQLNPTFRPDQFERAALKE